MPAILARAKERPEAEVVGLVAERIRVSVVVETANEIEVIWLAVTMRLLPGETELPPEWMPLLLAAFFPDVANPMDLQAARQLPTRDASSNEMVFVNYRG